MVDQINQTNIQIKYNIAVIEYIQPFNIANTIVHAITQNGMNNYYVKKN